MSGNPYAPPQTSVTDVVTRVRPRLLTVAVGFYLAAFPFFVARVAMGGHMQPFTVVFYMTLAGVYTALVAWGLLKGQQWARVMVWVFTVLWTMSALLSLLSAGLRERVVAMLIEIALKSAASIMLCLSPARGWFAPRT
jgi:hypothetical protein